MTREPRQCYHKIKCSVLNKQDRWQNQSRSKWMGSSALNAIRLQVQTDILISCRLSKDTAITRIL